MPRRKPYTRIGIRRRKCSRCKQPSYSTWQICALGRVFVPLCPAHDVALNALVLRWMKWPKGGEVLKRYRRKVESECQ